MKYLAHDTGTIISFYPVEMVDLYNEIPTPNIEVTEEQRQEYFLRGRQHRIVNGEFVYVEPPGRTLEELKACKWVEIKAERDKQEQSGVPYMGNVLDSDTLSVQRISIAVQAAQAAIAAGQEFALGWTCADNTTLNMTAEQVIGIPVALAQYSNSLHEKARLVRVALNNAESVEEVEAIQWQDT